MKVDVEHVPVYARRNDGTAIAVTVGEIDGEPIIQIVDTLVSIVHSPLLASAFFSRFPEDTWRKAVPGSTVEPPFFEPMTPIRGYDAGVRSLVPRIQNAITVHLTS